MSNPYFSWGTSPNRFIPFDNARAEEVNAGFDSVEVGFDSLQVALDAFYADVSSQLSVIATKANKTGDTYTGTHDFTGASIDVPTMSNGSATTAAASTAFVQTAIYNAALGNFDPALSQTLTEQAVIISIVMS